MAAVITVVVVVVVLAVRVIVVVVAVQGRPFRSVPGARISVRSGPFRSAAFHVVSELA